MKCSSCSLCHTSGINCMQGVGPTNAEVMIVGEAPGYHEEKQGQPFVGDTGWLLEHDLLPLLNKTRAEVYITNTCRCRPPDNRTPKPEEIQACRKHLYAEIESVKPKLCILLGAPAMQAVLGMSGIEKQRGQFYSNETFPGVTFIGTYHPAILWRVWEKAPIIMGDFRKAADFLTGSNRYAQELPAATKVTVCDTLEKVQLCIDKMTKAGVISYDTETTSLNHQEAKVLCVSFSCKQGEAWVIPLLKQYQQPFWKDEDAESVDCSIQDILNGEAQKIMQNGPFDLLISWSQGWSVRNYTFDTMLAAHLVDENLPVDLDTLVSMHTTMPQYSRVLTECWNEAKKLHKLCKTKSCTLPERDQVLAAGENYSLIDRDTLWHYAGCDADATLRCYHILKHRLEQQSLTKLFNELMMPMATIVAKLQWNGVIVDMDMMTKLHDEAEKQAALIRIACVDSLERKLPQTDLGIDTSIEPYRLATGSLVNLNLGSTKQLKEVLIDRLKWPVIKKSEKTGNPSFDAECMEAYRDKHGKREASMIIDWKKQRKMITDFLLGSDRKSGIVKHIYKDGRVHPTFKLHRARTGRLSAADPALHNIGRTGGLRHCYVPPDGWWWMETDFSQLELRLLMLRSKCPVLTSWYQQGLDVHRMVAAEVLSIAPDKVTNEQRVRFGKNINFGIVYGQREWSLAEAIGCSVNDARSYLARYFQRLPGVKPFFDTVLNDVYWKGSLVNAFGRIRHFHGAQLYSAARVQELNPGEELKKRLEIKRNDIDRQAMNFYMQSDGSDVLNKACIRIDHRLNFDHVSMDWGSKPHYESYLCHHHHDALHFAVHHHEILPLAEMVKIEMERPVPEFDGYSFPADFKLCRRWYDEDTEATRWLKEQLG